MESLWPEQIDELKVKPPVAILREQASLLGPKTQGIVEARVRSVQRDDPNGYEFAFRFDLVAPGLGQYTYSLFHICHDVELYPVRFVVDRDMGQEIRGDESLIQLLEVDSEEEFIAMLRRILRASKTRRIIGSLLAQAEYQEPQDEIPFYHHRPRAEIAPQSSGGTGHAETGLTGTADRTADLTRPHHQE